MKACGRKRIIGIVEYKVAADIRLNLIDLDISRKFQFLWWLIRHHFSRERHRGVDRSLESSGSTPISQIQTSMVTD